MSHFSPTSIPTIKSMLAANSYNNLNDYDKSVAEFQLGNTLSVIDVVQSGYKKYIQTQEKNHREHVRLIEDQIKSVNNLNKTLNVRFSAIESQIDLTNETLKSIKESLGIPEFEKKRRFYYAEGIRFLNLSKLNPKKYDDALCSFLSAEEINDKDHIVLYQIGLIYLHSSNNLNLKFAEEYLKRALELVEGIDDKIEDNCRYQLGYCYFIQTNLDKALDHLQKVKNKDTSLVKLLVEILTIKNDEELLEIILTDEVSNITLKKLMLEFNGEENIYKEYYEHRLNDVENNYYDKIREYLNYDKKINCYYNGDDNMYKTYRKILNGFANDNNFFKASELADDMYPLFLEMKEKVDKDIIINPKKYKDINKTYYTIIDFDWLFKYFSLPIYIGLCYLCYKIITFFW